ncbi:berberine bridge enzyme-like 15 [Macadamia integrifolia]|uniref:berberine bridge enzyme-like 15 n=1 Tax=Macadamia integrifolia TaxID=60698 RepID=UPI001C4F8D8C|nr:berberine bridge enzyme-like 15 [Macadamia integrifolia]
MGSMVSAILIIFSVLMFSVSLACSSSLIYQNFLKCATNYSAESISELVYSPQNSSFSSILNSTIQNLRLLSSKNPKPLLIITPTHESHIQAAVICSKEHSLQIKVRSGGHDYEGLSYLSNTLFIIIDLRDLRLIDVNMEDETAWVQAGATIGELYNGIAEKSSIHGFPAGICHAVGIGGMFSGGGIGTMMRKYGLACDNIVDALIVDVNGRILDRKLMGEGLFWAIRGGGAASFGVIISLQIKLVPVPPTITVFTVRRTLEGGATKLVHKWQHIADKLHEDLFIRIIIYVISGQKISSTVRASFNSLFLGSAKELLPLMENSFPELGLEAKDCIEMSWINSTIYFDGYRNGESAVDVLMNRTFQSKNFFKAKSDFVKEPISETGLEGIWKLLLEGEGAVMVVDPLGGKMSEISKSETPFPHRAGNLYNIQYRVEWQEAGGGIRATKKQKKWMKKLYKYMTPYVSNSPRAAYLNYRDLDLGRNKDGNTSYSKARVWGRKYFKNNFKRLALVKGKVDPGNFFWDEQSIPPLTSREQGRKKKVRDNLFCH